MLQNWLKVAFANYKKEALSTVINIIGLCLGFTGLLLVLLWWNHEKSFEQWNPNKNDVYYMYHKDPDGYSNNTSYAILTHAKEKIPEIEDIFYVSDWNGTEKIVINQKNFYQKGNFVTSENFFEIFPFTILKGSKNTALKDDYCIALEKETAIKFFNTIECIGKELQINDKNYNITAVYNLPETPELFRPLYIRRTPTALINDVKEYWGAYRFRGMLKLKKGTNPDIVADKLMKDIMYPNRIVTGAKRLGISPAEYQKQNGPLKMKLTSLANLRMKSEASAMVSDTADTKTIKSLFILSLLIIIISSINFINLKTAHAVKRAKEVGIRKSLGGTKFKLALQFMLEAFIICMVSAFLSFLVAYSLFPIFKTAIFSTSIAFAQPIVYAYFFIAIILIVFITGSFPAFYISNFKAVDVLKGNFSRSKKGTWLRNTILCLQMAVSAFFIISGLVIYKQVDFMLHKDLGFNASQVIRVNLSAKHEDNKVVYNLSKELLSKVKGVEDVSFSSLAPPAWNFSSCNVDYLNKSVDMGYGFMDYNFLKLLNISVVKGRSFSADFASDTISACMLNETAAKSLGWTNEQALSKQLTLGADGKKYTVIGIVKDYNFWDLATKIYPVFFKHYMGQEKVKHYLHDVLIKLNTNDIEATIKELGKIWSSKIEPNDRFDYSFIDKDFAQTFDKVKKQRNVFFILMLAVLSVALLGLFALSTFLIQQRLREISIRKVLGAETNKLVSKLVRNYLLLTILGFIISIPFAYYFMNKWLSGFAYRIDMPWLPYMLSFILLLALTFAVVSIKARAATKVKVIKWLKYE